MSNYVYPCSDCKKRRCDYEKCAAYRRWLNMAWGQFGRAAPHNYWLKRSNTDEKFCYIHPAVYRSYLQEGPCGRCNCCHCCESPCAKYWHWWDARMIWMQRKLQEQRKTPSPQETGSFL